MALSMLLDEEEEHLHHLHLHHHPTHAATARTTHHNHHDDADFQDDNPPDTPPKQTSARAAAATRQLPGTLMARGPSSHAPPHLRIFTFGLGPHGELGIGRAEDRPRSEANAVAFPHGSLLESPVQVALGTDHSLALVGGRVYRWGLLYDYSTANTRSAGQLGYAPASSSTAPAAPGARVLPSPSPLQACFEGEDERQRAGPGSLDDVFASVAAGGSNSYLLTHGGEVYFLGQLCPSDTHKSSCLRKLWGSPFHGPDLQVASIAAGWRHCLLLTRSGAVYTLGDDDYGQCAGVGSVQSPVSMPCLEPVVGVAAGSCHSVAWTAAGSCFSWGHSGHGRLGLGSLGGSYARVPGRVVIEESVLAAACGSNFTLFATQLGSAHSLWAAGGNQYGQLGLGQAYDSQDVPLRLDLTSKRSIGRSADTDMGEEQIVALACGVNFALCLTQRKSERPILWAWGCSGSGQCGRVAGEANGAASASKRFLPEPLLDFLSPSPYWPVSVSAGRSHAAVVAQVRPPMSIPGSPRRAWARYQEDAAICDTFLGFGVGLPLQQQEQLLQQRQQKQQQQQQQHQQHQQRQLLQSPTSSASAWPSLEPPLWLSPLRGQEEHYHSSLASGGRRSSPGFLAPSWTSGLATQTTNHTSAPPTVPEDDVLSLSSQGQLQLQLLKQQQQQQQQQHQHHYNQGQQHAFALAQKQQQLQRQQQPQQQIKGGLQLSPWPSERPPSPPSFATKQRRAEGSLRSTASAPSLRWPTDVQGRGSRGLDAPSTDPPRFQAAELPGFAPRRRLFQEAGGSSPLLRIEDEDVIGTFCATLGHQQKQQQNRQRPHYQQGNHQQQPQQQHRLQHGSSSSPSFRGFSSESRHLGSVGQPPQLGQRRGGAATAAIAEAAAALTSPAAASQAQMSAWSPLAQTTTTIAGLDDRGFTPAAASRRNSRPSGAFPSQQPGNSSGMKRSSSLSALLEIGEQTAREQAPTASQGPRAPRLAASKVPSSLASRSHSSRAFSSGAPFSKRSAGGGGGAVFQPVQRTNLDKGSGSERMSRKSSLANAASARVLAEPSALPAPPAETEPAPITLGQSLNPVPPEMTPAPDYIDYSVVGARFVDAFGRPSSPDRPSYSYNNGSNHDQLDYSQSLALSYPRSAGGSPNSALGSQVVRADDLLADFKNAMRDTITDLGALIVGATSGQQSKRSAKRTKKRLDGWRAAGESSRSSDSSDLYTASSGTGSEDSGRRRRNQVHSRNGNRRSHNSSTKGSKGKGGKDRRGRRSKDEDVFGVSSLEVPAGGRDFAVELPIVQGQVTLDQDVSSERRKSLPTNRPTVAALRELYEGSSSHGILQLPPTETHLRPRTVMGGRRALSSAESHSRQTTPREPSVEAPPTPAPPQTKDAAVSSIEIPNRDAYENAAPESKSQATSRQPMSENPPARTAGMGSGSAPPIRDAPRTSWSAASNAPAPVRTIPVPAVPAASAKPRSSSDSESGSTSSNQAGTKSRTNAIADVGLSEATKAKGKAEAASSVVRRSSSASSSGEDSSQPAKQTASAKVAGAAAAATTAAAAAAAAAGAAAAAARGAAKSGSSSDESSSGEASSADKPTKIAPIAATTTTKISRVDSSSGDDSDSDDSPAVARVPEATAITEIQSMGSSSPANSDSSKSSKSSGSGRKRVAGKAASSTARTTQVSVVRQASSGESSSDEKNSGGSGSSESQGNRSQRKKGKFQAATAPKGLGGAAAAGATTKGSVGAAPKGPIVVQTKDSSGEEDSDSSSEDSEDSDESGETKSKAKAKAKAVIVKETNAAAESEVTPMQPVSGSDSDDESDASEASPAAAVRPNPPPPTTVPNRFNSFVSPPVGAQGPAACGKGKEKGKEKGKDKGKGKHKGEENKGKGKHPEERSRPPPAPQLQPGPTSTTSQVQSFVAPHSDDESLECETIE